VVEGLEDECIGKEGDAGTSPDMRQKSGGDARGETEVVRRARTGADADELWKWRLIRMGTFMILAQLFAAFWSAAGTLTRQEAEGRELIPNFFGFETYRRFKNTSFSLFSSASFLGTPSLAVCQRAHRNWFTFTFFSCRSTLMIFSELSCRLLLSNQNASTPRTHATPPISSLPPLLFG
jgi:hypothetical protein